MKLLDFFLNRKKEKDFPENELEKLLVKGAENLAHRNHFYKKLLTSELFFLTDKCPNENGKNPIRCLKNEIIPIFTSTNRIFDTGGNKSMYYQKAKGNELLKAVKKSTIMINPFSKYSFKIPPQTINNMINGIDYNPKNQKNNSPEKKIKLEIRNIKKAPKKLIKELIKYFLKEPQINRAYIIEVKSENDNEFNILIGLVSAKNIPQKIFNVIIPIAENFCNNENYIDFVQVKENDNLHKFFLDKTIPFYKKNC